MKPRILIVDDEPEAIELVEFNLKQAGFEVLTAADGATALKKTRQLLPSLIVLDLMLPEMDGLEVCKVLRRDPATATIPILMLTAKAAEIDRVLGLELGADDYLTKPFDPAELLARVEALLRRVRKEARIPITGFRFGEVEVDFERAEVRKRGEPVTLAGKELQLLRYLVDHRGRVVPREELLQEVWEYRGGVSSRTVDVHVAWLRQKLENNPQNPQHIQTIRRRGYRFTP